MSMTTETLHKCPACSEECAQSSHFCSQCGTRLITTKNFVLGVDLDGVVADFYGALRPIAAEWRGVKPESLTPEVSYGLREWGIAGEEYQELHRFAVTQREIFLKQPPIEGAAATLRRLGFHDSIRVRIITHRLFVKYTHEISVRQTVEWLEAHGIPYWDICFMKEKGEVGADLYIEDSPNNIKALQAAGKDVLIFTNSTNKHVPGDRADTWEEVEKSVLRKVEIWEKSKGTGQGKPDGR
jgi:5'(3')-deoxyribonucleotidase